MKLKNKFFIFSLLCLQATIGYGQSKHVEKKSPFLEKKVYKVFSQSNPRSVLTDSLAIYAINFTVTIVKKNSTQTKVTKIIANDSLGYRIFPTYKQLEKINYIDLMGANKRVTFFIPILIYSSSPKRIKYTDDSGSPLINMQAALNAMYALISSTPYNNIKEAGEYLKYRLNGAYSNQDVFEKLIVARPMIFDLWMIEN